MRATDYEAEQLYWDTTFLPRFLSVLLPGLVMETRKVKRA